MGTETDKFDEVAAFIEPDQQKVIFNMAFHISVIVFFEEMWLILLKTDFLQAAERSRRV